MDAMAVDIEVLSINPFWYQMDRDLAGEITVVKNQGLRVATIGGNVAGEEFADPKFHPVWAKAGELGAVLFIHPQSPPELAKRLKGNGWLANTVGLPTETSA